MSSRARSKRRRRSSRLCGIVSGSGSGGGVVVVVVVVVILSTVFFVFTLFVFVLVVLSVAMNAFASAVDCVVFASAVAGADDAVSWLELVVMLSFVIASALLPMEN